MSTPSTMFACPGCGAALATGTTRCEHCRIRLTGELAMQLWRLDQQIAVLRGKREWLVTALRRDEADTVFPETGLPETVPPVVVAPSAPGTETRRALLGLGAVCLIAALTAATALIWPALGVGGQTAVLLLVTAALLAGAVRLQHRLPATADAIAAVGVAAAAVDLVAGRRLVAPHLSGGASHLYWLAGSLVIAGLLGYVGSRARRLHSPTVGAVLASYGAVVALVSPASVGEVALMGVLGAALSAAILRGAQQLPVMRTAAQRSALIGGAVFLTVGAGAALAGADERGLGLSCGLVLSVAIAAAPYLLRRLDDAATRLACGGAGGLLACGLLLLSHVVPLGASAVITAGVGAAVLMLAVAARTSSLQMSAQMPAAAFFGSAASLAELVAQLSLQSHAVVGAHLVDGAVGLGIVAVVGVLASAVSLNVESASVAAAGATCAVAGAVAEAFGVQGIRPATDATAVVASAVFLVAVAVLIVATRVRDVAVAAATAAVAGLVAAIAVDASIALRHVSTIEAYVIAPAAVTGVLGVLAMRRLAGLPSWSLLPALFVATVPTLMLALDGDLTRQVIVMLAAVALVALGAQCRLVAPLATGAVELVLVVGRVVGPEIQHLPRWLTLGVLGAALITLGSTWERRLQDVRRVTEQLRPAVTALR